MLLHERDHEGAVDAPRKERAERHVGDHALRHGEPQEPVEFFLHGCRIGFRREGGRRWSIAPSRVHQRRTRARRSSGSRRAMSRASRERHPPGELDDLAPDAAVLPDPALAQEGRDPRPAQAGPEAGERGESLELRGEGECAARERDKERLLAEAVPSEVQDALPAVEEATANIPAQRSSARVTPQVSQAREQHFRVGMAAKAAILCREVAANVLKIVDLAVERDDEAELPNASAGGPRATGR